jgi:hypothetical protein
MGIPCFGTSDVYYVFADRDSSYYPDFVRKASEPGLKARMDRLAREYLEKYLPSD